MRLRVRAAGGAAPQKRFGASNPARHAESAELPERGVEERPCALAIAGGATLTWADVDLRRGVIRLRAAHSKNKRPRVVMLRGELGDLLAQRPSRRRLDCPLVFHRDGQPLGDFRKVWATACSAAGVAALLFHDLRRSAARNMVRACVPERVAMAVSGHRTRAVFDRYNIVGEDDLAAAAEQTLAYVEAQRAAPATMASLAAVRDGRRGVQQELRGQNTDSRSDSAVAQAAAGSVRS